MMVRPDCCRSPALGHRRGDSPAGIAAAPDAECTAELRSEQRSYYPPRRALRVGAGGSIEPFAVRRTGDLSRARLSLSPSHAETIAAGGRAGHRLQWIIADSDMNCRGQRKPLTNWSETKSYDPWPKSQWFA